MFILCFSVKYIWKLFKLVFLVSSPKITIKAFIHIKSVVLISNISLKETQVIENNVMLNGFSFSKMKLTSTF
uniref:Uncharacterized protein n=1 Tax=Octopus bimaculoides TaxID=37653 RepID=A0A0L8FH29_OCTBM